MVDTFTREHENHIEHQEQTGLERLTEEHQVIE